MYLSRTAGHVHVVVRGDSLAASMSSYLTRRLEADPAITIHYGARVTALEGGDHLESLVLAGADGDRTIKTRALFVMIGAAPNAGWLSGLAETDAKGFVLTGAAAGRDSPYETSADGIFAVGDVRAGSVKRVASAVGEGSVVVSRIWDYIETMRRDGGARPRCGDGRRRPRLTRSPSDSTYYRTLDPGCHPTRRPHRSARKPQVRYAASSYSRPPPSRASGASS